MDNLIQQPKDNEPEIEECEIRCNDSVDQFYFDGLNMCPLSQVFNKPDFIGFKFEDGHVANGSISYASETNKYDFVHLDQVKNGHFTILHATHVLFRRKR